MSHFHQSDNQGEPQLVETACGMMIRLTPDTPSALYKDEVVYFCGQNCKQLFEEDPLSSCLSDRILSNK